MQSGVKKSTKSDKIHNVRIGVENFWQKTKNATKKAGRYCKKHPIATAAATGLVLSGLATTGILSMTTINFGFRTMAAAFGLMGTPIVPVSIGVGMLVERQNRNQKRKMEGTNDEHEPSSKRQKTGNTSEDNRNIFSVTEDQMSDTRRRVLFGNGMPENQGKNKKDPADDYPMAHEISDEEASDEEAMEVNKNIPSLSTDDSLSIIPVSKNVLHVNPDVMGAINKTQYSAIETDALSQFLSRLPSIGIPFINFGGSEPLTSETGAIVRFTPQQQAGTPLVPVKQEENTEMKQAAQHNENRPIADRTRSKIKFNF